MEQITLATDVLRGAKQISTFLYGSPDDRRKVYHLAETNRIPVFRLGAALCARKSKLIEHIEEQERQCAEARRPGSRPSGSATGRARAS